MKKKTLPKPPKIDPEQPVWAQAMGLTPKQELEHHRNWRRLLVAECGTDDIAVLAGMVKRIQTIKCGRCGKGVEAIAVGDHHHVTENHVCEWVPFNGQHTFSLKLG